MQFSSVQFRCRHECRVVKACFPCSSLALKAAFNSCSTIWLNGQRVVYKLICHFSWYKWLQRLALLCKQINWSVPFSTLYTCSCTLSINLRLFEAKQASWSKHCHSKQSLHAQSAFGKMANVNTLISEYFGNNSWPFNKTSKGQHFLALRAHIRFPY